MGELLLLLISAVNWMFLLLEEPFKVCLCGKFWGIFVLYSQPCYNPLALYTDVHSYTRSYLRVRAEKWVRAQRECMCAHRPCVTSRAPPRPRVQMHTSTERNARGPARGGGGCCRCPARLEVISSRREIPEFFARPCPRQPELRIPVAAAFCFLLFAFRIWFSIFF